MDSLFFFPPPTPYSLLWKAILSGLGEFGEKTEPSNAVILSFLQSTILTTSLSNPPCDHEFSVRCFQFVFQYDVDSYIWQIYDFSILPCHSFSSFRFFHLIVVAGFPLFINLHEVSKPSAIQVGNCCLTLSSEALVLYFIAPCSWILCLR